MDSEDSHVDAKNVYVLLTDRYRISRNIRAEWFLSNLNKKFNFSDRKKSLSDFTNEIDIISFTSTDNDDVEDEQTSETLPSSIRRFRIGCQTQLTFFSRKYCFVYVLDMSTSVTNIDVQHGTVLTDELYQTLAKCLCNIVKPFYVPGSRFLFIPEVYITIVAFIPFYSVDVNNVIVHGYRLSTENIQHLLQVVREKINFYIDLLYLNIKSETFHDVYIPPSKSIVPANLSLINMIRFGLLSLNLLPENSHQGIVIVTDGNTSFSDVYTLETALAQLRLSMISCSFVHVGSPPNPASSLGYVPYVDFMKFIAQATFGTYLNISPDHPCEFLPPYRFNIFHRAFFVYSFNHRTPEKFSYNLYTEKSNLWSIDNPYFYSGQDDETIRFEKKDQQLLRRKQFESPIQANFSQILSYRLREGFTIKRVNLLPNENIIELMLVLPWRNNVNIEYHISAYFHHQRGHSDSSPPAEIDDDVNFTSYEVVVESNYSFLHDATCAKKVFKSPLRATTIKQFCAALKHFNDSDNLGIHFHHFAQNELYRSIPESIKNGVSLFYLPPSSNVPVVSVPNEAHLKFAQYWKPICMLDVNLCQKSSLHTHQINVLLKHDHPLPEYLFHPNSFGRFETIQCKQSMYGLNVLLKEWSSFVLLENHSYIKLIQETENINDNDNKNNNNNNNTNNNNNSNSNSKSCSFYLIRIIAQPPCLVLHLAFIGGTSGSLRNRIVNELKQKLKQCKLPQRNLSSSLMQKSVPTGTNAPPGNLTPSESESPVIPDGDSNEDESSSSMMMNDGGGHIETYESPDDISTTSSPATNDNGNRNSNGTDDTGLNGGGTETENAFIQTSKHKRNSSNNANSSINCFVMLNRPIERMLIRYEKIPRDFYSCYKYEEDWKQQQQKCHASSSYASLNMFQTLVRFLYHQRFIWCTDPSLPVVDSFGGENYPVPVPRLSTTSLSKILTALTLKRIQEGFTLAYNEFGVVNLVKEFMMQIDSEDNIINDDNDIDDDLNNNNDVNNDIDMEEEDDDGESQRLENRRCQTKPRRRTITTTTAFPCLVQYIIFPSNVAINPENHHHHHQQQQHHHSHNLHETLSTDDDCHPGNYQNRRNGMAPSVNAQGVETPEMATMAAAAAATPLSSENHDFNQNYYDDNLLLNNTNTTITNNNNNNGNDIDSYDDEQKNLIVTECWIEPQNGRTPVTTNGTITTTGGNKEQTWITYDQISTMLYQKDYDLVSVLLTYEYLVSYDSRAHQGPNNGQRETRKKQHIPPNRTEPRFKHIPFQFDLLRLLDKSQQALIKFGTLYQRFEFDCDTESANEDRKRYDCTNIMLYSEFVHKISQLHDEIRFDHTETIRLIRKTNERLLRRHHRRRPDEQSSAAAAASAALFAHVDLLEADQTVRFRCFCKKISDDCIILTLLPVSYRVVRTLAFIDYRNGKINPALIRDFNPNTCYGSLVIPIIVHKLTFNSLTNILLHNYNPIEQLCPNWDLLFDYTQTDNLGHYQQQQHQHQPQSSSVSTGTGTEHTPISEEIAIENFTKTIEILFRNSFTDAIYKSLRYGFDSDDRDVKLVLEKICYKTIDYVDITDFLVYTCKHMKPVIERFFKKYPDRSIFDLLDFIDRDFADDDGLPSSSSSSSSDSRSKILSLNLPPSGPESCCHHNETLKSNFISLIQSHFSAIPTPSNSYYFYDYENIQAEKFKFDEVDVKRNEHLVKFYQKIENEEIDLDRFYEEICNSSKLLDQDIMNIGKDTAALVTDETEISTDTVTTASLADFQSLFLIRPFFVGFFYSLTLKNGTQARKISSIPTCLLDIISSQYTRNVIELENFRVYLNIEIITQNAEPQKISSNTSAISAGDNSAQTHNEQVPLKKLLDEFQVYKYIEFFDRIKWMIRDEIVSISHNMFQICPKTVQMVVEHIQQTARSNTSFIDKVELKFVFPLEDEKIRDGCLLMMDRFRYEFIRLQFGPGFRLAELGEYFYVVQDITTNDHDGCLDGANSIPANFWLVLQLELDRESSSRNNFVSLYFHSRQNIWFANGANIYGLEILSQLKKCLELLCKKFNQKFLLSRLFETRICDELLIPKDDPDPFIKNTIRSTSNSTPSNFWESSINSAFDLDYDSFDNLSLKILPTNFPPGSFSCDIVWDKHFPLHYRLHSYSSKEGFNTIRSYLSAFTVNNRNNLYVYTENTNEVYYMRIYEIECQRDSFLDNCRYYNNNHHHTVIDETNMMIDLSEYQPDNLVYYGCDDDEQKSRCDSDNDSVNSLNVIRQTGAMANVAVPQQCILMNVHGIVEPGKQIKEDMVLAVQRRLDEAVLGILILMLARNPHSKLSCQDVYFIQGRNSYFKNFYFTINETYWPYIENLKGYIRQNLSTFLHTPRYMDRNPETHFRLWKNNEFYCIKDEDVFIYLCHEESGKDTKGVACVIFSILSKESTTANMMEYGDDNDLNGGQSSKFNVSSNDMNDLLNGYFNYLVNVCNPMEKSVHGLMNLSGGGPGDDADDVKFFLHFQICYAGKIDLKYLGEKLQSAISHSLWEFNLEFKIFKLENNYHHRNNDDSGDSIVLENKTPERSLSEPSTPTQKNIRERRTGLVNVGLKPTLMMMENSPAVDGDGQFFNDDDQDNESIRLSYFLRSVIKPWLDFGKQIRIPSLTCHRFKMITKRSMFTMAKEFRDYISKFSTDMKMYHLMYRGQCYYQFDIEQIDQFLINNNNNDDDCNSYMILLRHESLWKAKYLNNQDESFVQNFLQTKCDSNRFEFPPLFHNNPIRSNLNGSNMTLNTTGGVGGGSLDKETETIRCLSPRQKFLLLLMENETLTVYLYNWNSNLTAGLMTWFSNMVLWHNSRSMLLHGLVLQKAGLFHNSPFKRHSMEKLIQLSNIPHKDLLMGYHGKSTLINNIFTNVDLLLKYTNPNKANNDEFIIGNSGGNTGGNAGGAAAAAAAAGTGSGHATDDGLVASGTGNAANRFDFVFETKNYDFVFSDFDHHQQYSTARIFDSSQQPKSMDLFDCFRGQFNSRYNTYIRDLKELSKVWQLHGTKLNHPTMDKIIHHVKSYGRLSHYCLTPFLFSHKWRYTVSLIRDHTVPVSPPLRQRHMSGGNIMKHQHQNTEHEFMSVKQQQRSRRKSGPANILEHSMISTMIGAPSRSASDDSLDMSLCPHYIQEYVQYLQSLGFSSIKSQKPVPSVGKKFDFEKRFSEYSAKFKSTIGGMRKINTAAAAAGVGGGYRNEYEKFYLIKTVVSGFYLFEVGFAEPFVYSYLYSIDSKRFTSWMAYINIGGGGGGGGGGVSTTNKSTSGGNITNFLDELDSIKVRMHLHSFTYDYHLRAIHSYISGRQLFFQRGYHLISFLDDFLKYYQKAPNYSRNHVYSDVLVYESNQIGADQLYSYIIRHSADYGIKVFPMSSSSCISFDGGIQIPAPGINEEYVLIHLSSRKINYLDENQQSQEDNFDLGLLVTYQKINNARLLKPRQLCLKFFLLLTSQRELYPKLFSFQKKGLFQTIRMLTNGTGGSSSPVANDSGPPSFNNNNGSNNTVAGINNDPRSVLIRNPTEESFSHSIDRSTYMGICDEKINYLGYFNAHEIVMLGILEQKVNETKQFLQQIIEAAEIDCRRDNLWQSLISVPVFPNNSNNNASTGASAATEPINTPMTMDDFNELLSLVKSIRLEEYDPNLIQFNTFNFNWYRMLAQKLEMKFEFNYRKFIKNGILKMAFSKSHCQDCFILFHLKNSPSCQVEFRIVFNHPPDTVIDRSFLERCDSKYHELVEDFVNTCTSHMWTIMLN